jgi:NifB/MoaA-like Fe-S oxidoreductase
MDTRELREVLRQSALLHAVLPLSSVCNVRCLFCSNNQNPLGVETYSIPPRPLDEVLEDIPLLRSHEKVNIGESATRINEGEPYTYDGINVVLSALRKRLPGAVISLTTNGTLVTEDDVRLLSELGAVEVTLSLNARSPEARESLMADRDPGRALQTVRWLNKHGVTFSGSMVAMPCVTGWADFEDSVRLLAESGAETVRVFLPGFTGVASAEVERQSRSVDVGAVLESARRLTEETDVPVIVEPVPMTSSLPLVHGVIKDSYAAHAGVRPGDELKQVDGSAVVTATTAYDRITRAASPALTLERGGIEVACMIQKPSGAPSGLVFRGDLDARRLMKTIERLRTFPGRSAVITSVLAGGYWEDIILGQALSGRTKVFAAENRFFGGNIRCAGLLTVSDFAEVIRGAAMASWGPGLVLMPGEPFDHTMRDLIGVCWEELRRVAPVLMEVL